MAVYTQVDDYALNDFLAGYDVGEAISFKGIAEGVENSNYLLETTKGRYILTLYEKRANPADLPYFLNLMEHLAAGGLSSPLPVRDKEGQALQELAGRPACLITFLSGVSLNHIAPDHCAALGTTLAQMHAIGESFSENRPNELSVQGWEGLARATKDEADKVYQGLADMISEEITFLKANWPQNLPTGTIHADLFPDNALFTGTSITGVIDFYFACTDLFAYDLAICINAWCFDEQHSFLPENAAKMVAAYQAAKGLTQEETDALPILCRGAAVRFLLTRLYDWLNPVKGAVVRAKDPLDYLKRLQFHQSAKAETYMAGAK